MRSYLSYFKLRFITNLQYRAAALAGISTQLFFGFIFLLVYYAFYQSNPNSSLPMAWDELVTYIWLQQAFYSLIYPYERDQELLNMISDGNLAYEIIRPQNIFIKFYIKMVAKKMVAALLRSIPVIVVAFLLPHPFKLSIPYSFSNFLLFILALISSCFLISVLVVLVHFIVMFTIDSKGTITIYSVIVEVFSGNSGVPLPFFPNWLRTIANILPFKFICDFPFRVYSNSISVIEGISLFIQSIIWIIVFLIIGLLISKIALKKAVIQGG